MNNTRPDDFTLELLRNGAVYDGYLCGSVADGNLQYERFGNATGSSTYSGPIMYKYTPGYIGRPCAYTLNVVATGYTVTITGNAEDGFTVTIKYGVASNPTVAPTATATPTPDNGGGNPNPSPVSEEPAATVTPTPTPTPTATATPTPVTRPQDPAPTDEGGDVEEPTPTPEPDDEDEDEDEEPAVVVPDDNNNSDPAPTPDDTNKDGTTKRSNAPKFAVAGLVAGGLILGIAGATGGLNYLGMALFCLLFKKRRIKFHGLLVDEDLHFVDFVSKDDDITTTQELIDASATFADASEAILGSASATYLPANTKMTVVYENADHEVVSYTVDADEGEMLKAVEKLNGSPVSVSIHNGKCGWNIELYFDFSNK